MVEAIPPQSCFSERILRHHALRDLMDQNAPYFSILY